jgi:cytoskeletal protein CcmA (bactofilin family)
MKKISPRFAECCRVIRRLAPAVALLCAINPAAAAENLYLGGPDVKLEQRAQADLVAAAGRLSVDGGVEGDAVLAAGSIDVRSPVNDDLRAAGGIITLASSVKGETLVAGASVHVAPSADLAGRVWLAGNEVTIAGKLRGEVKAYGRTITISGDLQGPVSLSGERIEVLAPARIQGDVTYSSTHDIVIHPDARIAGKVVRQPGVFQMPRPKMEIPGLAAARPLLLFGLLAAGVLLYAVFPRYTVNAAHTLGQAPLKSLGLGAAMFFSAPPIILLLVITIIGIPLALVVAALYAVSLLAAYLMAAFFVGERLLDLVGQSAASKPWHVAALAVALVAFWLLRQIPYAGGMITLGALLFGLGALTLQAFTQYADRA